MLGFFAALFSILPPKAVPLVFIEGLDNWSARGARPLGKLSRIAVEEHEAPKAKMRPSSWTETLIRCAYVEFSAFDRLIRECSQS
jgi:hypothetical protein